MTDKLAKTPPSSSTDYPKEDFLIGHEVGLQTRRLNRSAESYKNKRGYAEGGVVENVDPVSGNPVPPGGVPQDVRDDVDAKLSSGEYVIPADVVRFFGIQKFESLITQAKEKMQELSANGRVGGQDEEDLPFSPEELQVAEEAPAQGEAPVQMAAGGLVAPRVTPSQFSFAQPTTTQAPAAPAAEVLPDWMKDRMGQDADPPATGFAGSVNQWGPEDFKTFADTRGNLAQRAIEWGVSKIPFGGLVNKAYNKHLDKTVPSKLQEMIKTGVDLKGNKLNKEQVAGLQQTLDKVTAMGEYTPGLRGLVPTKDEVKDKGVVGSLKDSVTESMNAKKGSTEKAAKEKSAPEKGDSGGHISRRESSKDKNDKDSKDKK